MTESDGLSEESPLKYRETIIQALGIMTEEFSHFDLANASIENALALLGKATEVSRVNLFQNHTNSERKHLCSQRYTWTAPGIVSLIATSGLQNIPLDGAVARWMERLRQGKLVMGHSYEFPERERAVLDEHHIKSILIIPIFMRDLWWGFIGLDEFHSFRNWTESECEMLRIAAHLFSTALQCQQMEHVRIQHQLSIELSSTSDLDYALNHVLEVIAQINEIDCSGVYLVDPHTGNMMLAAHRGLNEAFLEANKQYRFDSLNSRLTMEGFPFYGIYSDIANGYEGYLLDNPRAVAIIPIQHDNHVIASLNMASRSKDSFSPNTRAFAEAIAAQIGGTLARLGMESALKASEQNLQTLFDSIQDFLLIVAPDGHFLKVNPAAINQLGYSEEEFLKLSVPDLHPPEYREEAKRSIEAILQGENDTCSLPLVTSDGTIIPVDTRVTHGKWNNQDVFFGISRDLSERKRLEEQLRQAQKMEAVGHLAGGVAHDFNNLLQVVLGHTDLLMGDLDSDSPIFHDLEDIHKAADKAAALTKQLLAFSRRQVLQPIDINLNETISDLLSMLRRLVGEHIELITVSAGNLATVHADPSQIEQVVMNLCINARDAMPTGGQLTIETKNMSLSPSFCEENLWATPGQYAMFSVKDTGHGMDEQTCVHIFEPFFTTKEVGRGTGLGLATVYGIVKQHNGLIHVQSAINLGTSFHIFLPAVEREVETPQNKVANNVCGGHETILVAEDEGMVLELVTRILTGAGYTVLAAHNGEEALRLYDEHASQISLLLLDVMMPKLGGRDVMDCVRAWDESARFLFSSGYSESAIHTDFIIHDGFHLIQKPYRRADLLRAVREAIDA